MSAIRVAQMEYFYYTSNDPAVSMGEKQTQGFTFSHTIPYLVLQQLNNNVSGELLMKSYSLNI